MNNNSTNPDEGEELGPSVDYIQVQAPSDLPEGYVFQVNYGSRMPFVTVVGTYIFSYSYRTRKAIVNVLNFVFYV